MFIPGQVSSEDIITPRTLACFTLLMVAASMIIFGKLNRYYGVSDLYSNI